MKVTIESTTMMVEADGVQCRIWEGETERGVKVQCLIARVAALEGEDLSQFEAELEQMRAPSPDVRAFPLRMIL